MLISIASKLSLLLILLCSFNSYSNDLKDFVESSSRNEANVLRDVYRNPFETLSFFGLESNMSVVELSPGGGWYTEILAPYLKESGNLIVAHFNPDLGGYYEKSRRRFEEKIKDKIPELVSKIKYNQNKYIWMKAALGIMTTDTQPKMAMEKCNIGGSEVKIYGIAKGSGMIQPNMATT